jgi:hypothetical protein
MKIKFLPLLAICLLNAQLSASGQIASAGPYTLHQTVIAGGGGETVGGAYLVEKTSAQPVAGTISTGGAYSVHGGFWSFRPLGPTSANVSISGRVVRIGGAGLSKATLTLYGGPFSTPHTALTSSLGYFNFENIPVGYFYILSVHHRQYSFAQSTYEFSLFDDVSDIVFHANEIP